MVQSLKFKEKGNAENKNENSSKDMTKILPDQMENAHEEDYIPFKKSDISTIPNKKLMGSDIMKSVKF